MVSGKFKVVGDRDTASGIRSSAPELHLLAETAVKTHTSEPRRKQRQFVVVAVADDVKRLTPHPGVHSASGVRRSGSCTLPTEMRSPTTTRRYVISLTNLDAGKISSDVVLPQCSSSSPTSSERASSIVASGCSSDHATSLTVTLEAPSSTRCTSTSDGDCHEVSKELWSLRALLANREDISMDESVDEATAAARETATTPQSADDVSVKSSADTVISVDDRPSPTTSTAPTTTTAVADTQPSSAAAAPTSSADEGITRVPSIRRQNYREAIARRQNHRLQTEAVVAAGSNELSIPTSSVEASSEPTDNESSLSFERWTYGSSNETTASSIGDSMTSTDSTAGGSGSDGHGGGHRLEHLRGDSGYRSLEAQQSLGQARDFRRQSASHFFLDSSANVIYEDQMSTATATSSDDVRTVPSSSSSVVVSVQQMQCSTSVGVSIPLSLSTADSAASGSANVRSGHRHNKAAQRKRIQYRCERQAVEIHDSVTVGDPIEYKATHQSHHHHHQHHQPPQPHRRSTDTGSAMENLGERGLMGTTTSTTTTKPSLFSRFLRTAHIGSGSSASGSASRRNTLVRIQRDYSIDERSNAIFNEFLRHDPAYDTKQTLSVHARSSRSARRSRIPRSPMSTGAGRCRLTVDEHVSSTLSTAETLSGEGHVQWLRDSLPQTAPNTATTSPLLTRKHLLTEALADPRVSTSRQREGRRRSEGNSRLATDVTSTTDHTTSDARRRASTSVDQSASNNRRSSDTEPTTAESRETLPPRRGHDDARAAADVGDVVGPHMSTTSEHSCQRRTGATSHRIPVIQLTTDEDTLQ